MLRFGLMAMAAALVLAGCSPRAQVSRSSDGALSDRGAAPASAHDQELRPGANFPPRVGRMSEEVIVQRLRLDGIENARIISRDGNAVRVQGMRAGRLLQLEVQALSGKVFDVSTSDRRLLIGGDIAAQRPLIVGPQIRVERERLGDPQLMNNVTERIRPVPQRQQ